MVLILIPFLKGEKKGVPHELLFWRKFDANDSAIRSGNIKSVSIKGGEKEFYDLDKDISEANQLAANPEFQKMNDAYTQWLHLLQEPAFLGLMQDDEYNELNPNRFNLERY